MKVIASTAGLAAMVLSLAVPGMLLAQEPPAEETEASSAAVTESESEVSPPASEQAPVDTGVVSKANASVDMIDYEFRPKTVTINVGENVSWTNTGDEDHDADGDDFTTGTLEPGDEGSNTFNSAGTFKYICTFHPDMKGTVVVKDDSGGTGERGDDGTGDSGGTSPTTTDPSGTSGTTSSDSSLPATGQNEIPLIIVGASLLICGLLVGALWRAQTGP